MCGLPRHILHKSECWSRFPLLFISNSYVSVVPEPKWSDALLNWKTVLVQDWLSVPRIRESYPNEPSCLRVVPSANALGYIVWYCVRNSCIMLSSRVFSVRDTDSACPEANKSRLLQTQAPIEIRLLPISMISPESDSREVRCPMNALMNDHRQFEGLKTSDVLVKD